MSDRGAVGIVVCHASLAEGLVEAVRRIADPEPGAFVAISNEGCAPETLRARIVEAAGDDRAIIFADLPSGSCVFAARSAARPGTEIPVVGGVNLPMLLDFAFHRHLPAETLVPRLVELGRQSIRSLQPRVPDADPAVPGR